MKKKLAEMLSGLSEDELIESDLKVPDSADECKAVPTPRQNIRFRAGRIVGWRDLESRREKLRNSTPDCLK